MAIPGIFGILGFGAFVFGCGIGIPMVYFGVTRSRKRDDALDRVETTEGTITTSGVEEVLDTSPDGGRRYRYRPQIRFRYEYDGETYESDRRAYNMLFGKTNESHAWRTANEYAEGTTVTVHVDPQDPDVGFLEIKDTRQSLVTVFFVLVGGGCILMGLVGVLFVALTLL